MGVVAIDHVQVAAPPGAEEEARNFYGELLGLPEISKPPALLKGGGAREATEASVAASPSVQFGRDVAVQKWP